MDPYTMMMMIQSMGKGKGKGKGKRKSGLSKFAPEKKVWLGGVPEGTTYQELQEYLASIDCPAKFVAIFSGKGAGTGGAAFAEESEATNAIKALKAKPSFKGGKLEVDVWTKL